MFKYSGLCGRMVPPKAHLSHSETGLAKKIIIITIAFLQPPSLKMVPEGNDELYSTGRLGTQIYLINSKYADSHQNHC